MKLLAAAIVCIAALVLAGCGGSGRKQPIRAASAPRVQDLLLGLNRLGWVDGNCTRARRFSVTVSVPMSYATDEVTFAVAGEPNRTASIDPGKSRTWEVPTETVRGTVRSRPITVKLVQATEPQTLTATVRMLIERGGGSPGECLVNPATMQQRSVSHTGP